MVDALDDQTIALVKGLVDPGVRGRPSLMWRCTAGTVGAAVMPRTGTAASCTRPRWCLRWCCATRRTPCRTLHAGEAVHGSCSNAYRHPEVSHADLVQSMVSS